MLPPWQMNIIRYVTWLQCSYVVLLVTYISVSSGRGADVLHALSTQQLIQTSVAYVYWERQRTKKILPCMLVFIIALGGSWFGGDVVAG